MGGFPIALCMVIGQVNVSIKEGLKRPWIRLGWKSNLCYVEILAAFEVLLKSLLLFFAVQYHLTGPVYLDHSRGIVRKCVPSPQAF